jgi:hypothetical protein
VGEETKAQGKLEQAPHTEKKQVTNNGKSKYSASKLTALLTRETRVL